MWLEWDSHGEGCEGERTMRTREKTDCTFLLAERSQACSLGFYKP